jgi:hypothetical protein
MQPVRTRLGAVIPDEWDWKESLTFLAPGGDANVIYSSEPLDGNVDLDRYVSVQGELLLAEFPGYREIALERMQMMGRRQGCLRRFEWSPPEGVPVTQLQLYYVEDARGYTATATTPTTNFPTVDAILVDILQRLTLEGAPRLMAGAEAEEAL